jgi:peptidoglycan/xylan/chitin deacetylase (PgdA/CDA1 family)
MIQTLQRRLRRRWHHVRRRRASGAAAPKRLVVGKAAWFGGAQSAVMLMIDDLTNAWHNREGGTMWEPGGDWGGGLDRRGSALDFLERQLLDDFPEARVTFFTVAGPIASYTHHQPFSHAAPLDVNEASRRFFAAIAADPRFELAYHGYDHGTPGERTDRFVQEWQGFVSPEAAVEQTRRGLEIFRRATGRAPQGGKYGGWEYNAFAERAIDECGFTWWCRDWMPRDVAGRVSDTYYDPQFFGPSLVVALPSTVHGHFWDRRQIDLLLARRQLITIEEHIAPIRPDGLIQTPNIVDDIDDLRGLYRYLRRKHVWHATGTEIASYVIARERSLVCDVTHEGFSIRYDGRVQSPLTLVVDCAAVCSAERPGVDITMPDGETLDARHIVTDARRYRHRITIPVVEGRYRVWPRRI